MKNRNPERRRTLLGPLGVKRAHFQFDVSPAAAQVILSVRRRHGVMLMKSCHLLLAFLFIAALTSSASAQEPAPDSAEQAYSEYLAASQAMQDAYLRDYQIRMAVLLAIGAGILLLAAIPFRRAMNRALDISAQHQRTLEEIRDLLKKS